MKNRNHTPVFGLPPEQLDALFARSNDQALADRDARQRAAAWPGEVERLLASMACELVALRERVDAVEVAARRG